MDWGESIEYCDGPLTRVRLGRFESLLVAALQSQPVTTKALSTLPEQVGLDLWAEVDALAMNLRSRVTFTLLTRSFLN